MNLSEVCEELAARLRAIDELNVFSHPVGDASVPFACVLNPDPGDLRYDATYGRGSDEMTLPLVVLAGSPDAGPGHEQIRAYLDGSGPRSVKTVLESFTYTTFDRIRVSIGGVGVWSWGGGEYLAALFDLEITGPGSG